MKHKNHRRIIISITYLLLNIFAYGQSADSIVKQIKIDIYEQNKFEYKHFKFNNVELIYEFVSRDCGGIKEGTLIEKSTFNSSDERDIVEVINKQHNKVYPIFKQGQIEGILNVEADDPDFLYISDVRTIIVFNFKQDTLVDIVFSTGFDVGSYNRYYHCLFTFNEFKFMKSFESQSGGFGTAIEPFGDFNNDGNLDFIVDNWSGNIVLYTLKDEIFELCTDYKIELNYEIDEYYPLIDKTSTKINVLIDEQWITIP